MPFLIEPLYEKRTLQLHSLIENLKVRANIDEVDIEVSDPIMTRDSKPVNDAEIPDFLKEVVNDKNRLHLSARADNNTAARQNVIGYVSISRDRSTPQELSIDLIGKYTKIARLMITACEGTIDDNPPGPSYAEDLTKFELNPEDFPSETVFYKFDNTTGKDITQLAENSRRQLLAEFNLNI